MNKKGEQVEEQGRAIPTKMDASAVAKKRDTSFVGERKKQIELYGNYYPAGLSDQEILEWVSVEHEKLKRFSLNLLLLDETVGNKIESDRQAKLAEIWNKLSESEKQQLKSMPV